MGQLPDNLKPVICIAGPTASGKSSWAIDIAKSVDGEIINADSMQIYDTLHVITARPSLEEMADVPHHLFGQIPISHQFSTGQWVEEAVDQIMDCLSRGKTPILVGGTGLYFKALTDGLAIVPDPGLAAIKRSKEFLKEGIEILRAEAQRLDPVASARVLGDDSQRLLRIVSVGLGTDKPLSAWQANTKPIIPQGYWLGAVLMPDREVLYKKINDRFEWMMEHGGLEEVQVVREMSLNPALTAMKAIGVPPFLDFLDGKISYEEAISRAQRDTRRYAKRQFTWFRGQAEHWFSVKNSNDRLKFRQKISHFYI